MSLLSVKKLRREYERGGRRFAAVDNVTFSMECGESVSIIGRSGSGKTTFISMVAGLISPTEGEVILDGNDIFALDDAAASRLRNEVIGYIPQGASLLPALTALDNVRLPLYLSGGKRAGDGDERGLALLEAMGLGNLRDAYPAAMSGGEMRRVAIARALINTPKVIIADEPTSDLDEDSAADVMRLLAQAHAQGTALLLVTHDTELAVIADRVMTMASGKLAPAARAVGAAAILRARAGGTESRAS